MDSLTQNFNNMEVSYSNINIDLLTNQFTSSCIVDKNYIYHERTRIGLDIYNKAKNMLENTALFTITEFVDFFTTTKIVFKKWYDQLFYKNWNTYHKYTQTQLYTIQQIKDEFEIYFEIYDVDILQSLHLITTILYEFFLLNDIVV